VGAAKVMEYASGARTARCPRRSDVDFENLAPGADASMRQCRGIVAAIIGHHHYPCIANTALLDRRLDGLDAFFDGGLLVLRRDDHPHRPTCMLVVIHPAAS